MPRYLSPLVAALRTLGLLAAGLAVTAVASAAGLQVAPVALQISNRPQAEGIWLSNVGQVPLHAQVRVFAWSQKDGADQLTPSTELTVSPPLLDIAPGARQLLRVIRSSAPPPVGTERTYRLIVDELPVAALVPPPATEGEADEAAAAPPEKVNINFVMRYSLPVFVGDVQTEPIAKHLRWRLHQGDEQWTLEVHNSGAMRAQISNLQALGPAGSTTMLRGGMLGYVLPGSTMAWTLSPPDPAAATGSYQVMINEDTLPIQIDNAP